jgi:hypothetical protein
MKIWILLFAIPEGFNSTLRIFNDRDGAFKALLKIYDKALIKDNIYNYEIQEWEFGKWASEGKQIETYYYDDLTK